MIRMTRGRWLVLLVLVVAIVAHMSGATSFLTFESLKKHRQSLRELVQTHSLTSPIVFVVLYAVVVTLALPGATILTLTAGIIFSQPWATILSVLGAATGACCNYYLSSCAFKSSEDDSEIRRKLGMETTGEKPFKNGVSMFYGLISWEKIAQGIKENEAVYMLLLRLVPIFPFWFVNIAPSVLGVKFSTFAWTTYLGILPGSYVYTQCGYGISSMMEEDLQNETLFSFLVKGIFNKHTAAGLVLLFLWLCFLLVVRWWVTKRKRAAQQKLLEAKEAEKKKRKEEKNKEEEEEQQETKERKKEEQEEEEEKQENKDLRKRNILRKKKSRDTGLEEMDKNNNKKKKNEEDTDCDDGRRRGQTQEEIIT